MFERNKWRWRLWAGLLVVINIPRFGNFSYQKDKIRSNNVL